MDDDIAEEIESAEADRWLDISDAWECLTCGTRERMYSMYECVRCHESRMWEIEHPHGY